MPHFIASEEEMESKKRIFVCFPFHLSSPLATSFQRQIVKRDEGITPSPHKNLTLNRLNTFRILHCLCFAQARPLPIGAPWRGYCRRLWCVLWLEPHRQG